MHHCTQIWQLLVTLPPILQCHFLLQVWISDHVLLHFAVSCSSLIRTLTDSTQVTRVLIYPHEGDEWRDRSAGVADEGWSPDHTAGSWQNQDLTTNPPELSGSGACAITAEQHDVIPGGF